MGKKPHPDVVRALQEVADHTREAPYGHTEARRVRVDGYRMDIAAKRLDPADPLWVREDRQYRLMLRVDRQAAERDNLAHDDEALSWFLASQEPALDTLFRPYAGKRYPAWNPVEYDLTTDDKAPDDSMAPNHIAHDRHRTSLWTIGHRFVGRGTGAA